MLNPDFLSLACTLCLCWLLGSVSVFNNTQDDMVSDFFVILLITSIQWYLTSSSLVCSTACLDVPSVKQTGLFVDRLSEKLWKTDLRSDLEGGIHTWESIRAVKRTAAGRGTWGEKESEGRQRLKVQRRDFILNRDLVQQHRPAGIITRLAALMWSWRELTLTNWSIMITSVWVTFRTKEELRTNPPD